MPWAQFLGIGMLCGIGSGVVLGAALGLLEFAPSFITTTAGPGQASIGDWLDAAQILFVFVLIAVVIGFAGGLLGTAPVVFSALVALLALWRSRLSTGTMVAVVAVVTGAAAFVMARYVVAPVLWSGFGAPYPLGRLEVWVSVPAAVIAAIAAGVLSGALGRRSIRTAVS